MKRIFIAVNLPEGIKKELENLQKEIGGLFPEDAGAGLIKWVKPEHLHLTLLFIGYAENKEVAEICEIVKRVGERQRRFSLRLKRVSYGPPGKLPPRLLWLDLEKKPELIQLARDSKREMAAAGVLKRIEQRPFSPHITLARIRAWRWSQIEPEERPDVEKELALNFEVKSIEVMESRLKRTGAEYAVLSSVPFEN